MSGIAANFGSVFVFVWGLSIAIGLIAGTFFARRDVAMGTCVLILMVLTWSMFIGLLPIVNNALQPEGFAGIFSSRGFAKFLEDAAPQAIFYESASHRNQALIGSGIGAVLFAAAGLIASAVMRQEDENV